MTTPICGRCDQPIREENPPWDVRTHHPHERHALHYECRLREQWAEFKRIIAEMNDTHPDKVLFVE